MKFLIFLSLDSCPTAWGKILSSMMRCAPRDFLRTWMKKISIPGASLCLHLEKSRTFRILFKNAGMLECTRDDVMRSTFIHIPLLDLLGSLRQCDGAGLLSNPQWKCGWKLPRNSSQK